MNFIETQRLYIRPFSQNDLSLLLKLHGDQNVMRFHPGFNPRPQERIIKDLDAFIEHQKLYGYSFWAVFEKDTGFFAGRVGLWHLDKTELVELGYSLFKEFWGKGLGTEMGKEILKYGFQELKLNSIYAVIHPENSASQKVAQKLGFDFLKQTTYYNMPVKLYLKTADSQIGSCSACV